jgi:uncharacterized repeat protein (TIGR02543 family)
MTTSDSCVDFIKSFEGFRSHIYWDGGAARIGYGTGCKSTDYPNGISEATGEALLRDALKVKETAINSFLAKNSITLAQYQYDAILSLTYNLGTMWMDSDYSLYSYLKSGVGNYSDIEIVNAIGTWCHAGGKVLNQLVTRRLREAKMFLYNDYTGSSPHDYKYLTFDAGSGDVGNSIMFFEVGKPYGAIQAPTRSGYTFAGWYTAGGTLVSSTTTVSENLAVTASWTTGTPPPAAQVFSDVGTADWFYKYVIDLNASSIVTGYPDGGFHPADTVSGGVALKLILRAAGFEEQQPTSGNWASGYLTLALSKAIVDDGDIINLDAPISRLIIAEIAAKTIGLPPIDTGETTFQDTADGYVLALYHTSIITGTQESGGLMFHPDNNISRAEISAIIWRISNSGIIPA